MLEKNKDYVEFTLQTMMATHRPYKDGIEVSMTGVVNGYNMSWPGEFDVPADVVVISKRAFDRLQADNQHYRELAKQREENYNLLLENTGFTSVADLIDYICDPSMTSPENKTLKEIIDECEKDYISERDKAEALKIENERLKSKLHEYDPFSDFKELFKKLYSIEDTEALEWALNHTVGGLGSVNGWRAVSSFWSEKYKTLSKLVGFSSVEEIQDYLTNEAECDTLNEAISKLKDQVKYTCEEWYGANGRNNSWKAAAECNSPKELIEKREALEKEIEVYSRALKEWKESTDCPSPSVAKSLLKHYCEENKKLQEKIDELRDDISGRSTVIEHYKRDIDKLQDRLNTKKYNKLWITTNGMLFSESDKTVDVLEAQIEEASKVISDWQNATGCDTPDQVKSRIEGLENAIRLTKMNMLSELERKIDEWQTATGCVAPEKAQYKITDLYNRIDKMKEAASIASNWIDKIVEG